MEPQEVLLAVAQGLWWVVATLYYMLEALVLLLVPRSYLKKDIKGSVVLVTGGGSGIGRLMCRKLAACGAIIVTWDVSEEGNEETGRLVRGAGGRCYTFKVDLCDRQAIYAAAAKVKQQVGKVDILVNNAGIVTGKSLLDSPDDCIQRTFQVNSICHFWTTKAFLPDMLAGNSGHVVTIASMAGKIPCAGLVDYCSSKFAAVGFHESVTEEIKAARRTGVKTTCVCPIVINTGMFTGASTRIFPLLESDWVAGEIVDGVLMNVSTLYLPSYMWLMPLMPLLLPKKSIDLLGRILGLEEVMKDFVGRKKE